MSRSILALAIMVCMLSSFACRTPSGISSAPKIIEADGVEYIACSGLITVYQPSRDVADSSQQTYEITFTDEFGESIDLKQVKNYTILRPDSNEAGPPPSTKRLLTYAMPAAANPSNNATTYSSGEPMHVGDIVTFGKGQGKARWLGPGKWEPVPCGF
jgi:hypothetical protein